MRWFRLSLSERQRMIGVIRRGWMVSMVLLAVLTVGRAEAQGAEGSWTTEIASGMRNENGFVTSEGKVAFRLEIKVDGEQVTGSWGPAESRGTTPAARRGLKGTLKGNVLSLTAEAQQARLVINDEESVVQLIPTFRLTVDGDTLKGTYQLVPADGHEGMPAMNFIATKVKG
jgi:hypothetical protein